MAHWKVMKSLYHFLKGLFESFSGITSIFYLKDDQIIKRVSPTRANALRQKQRRPTTPVKQEKESRRSKAIKRISQCVFLDGLCFVVIIITHEYMFSPVWQMILTFLKSYDHCIYLRPCYFICWLLGEIFSILWIIPFFLLSKLINVFLFQDIADCVYTPTRGLSRSKSKQISIPDLICSLGVQILFLLQITLLNYNPFPALTYPCYALRMFLTCLLYSQYAFEYKWINMGLNLSARLNFIENEWPYFFGFGLPMFLCSEYPESFFASSFVFSVVFPFFIITGSAGNPPYDTGYITLPVFFPTMYMINRIISLFSKSDTNTHHTQQNR